MLANHCTNPKHNFDFSNPKILDKEHNLKTRLILEMIEILNKENSINKRTDMDCFSNVDKQILEKNNFSLIFIFLIKGNLVTKTVQLSIKNKNI